MSGGRVELGLGRRVVRDASTRRTASRSRRSASASTAWRSSSRSSPGCGRPRTARRSPSTGRTTSSTDSPALPKPVQQPRPPVIVGGAGPRRTPRLAARYADEYNVAFRPSRIRPPRSAASARPAQAARARSVLRDLLRRLDGVLRQGRGRVPPPGGRDRLGAGPDPRERVGGTPGEVVAKLAEFAEIGAERVYLQVLDLHDLDHLALVASDVMPQVCAARAGVPPAGGTRPDRSG